MDPHGTFLPPKNEEEFNERAAKIELGPAKSILSTLKARREAMVKTVDLEIAFYEKVVELKESQA